MQEDVRQKKGTLRQLGVCPAKLNRFPFQGHGGRIAKEIRALMRSVAQRQGKKISVDIVD